LRQVKHHEFVGATINPAQSHLIGVELHSKNENRAMVTKLTCAVATTYCFPAMPTAGKK
jgi:hypothetical protein